MKVNSITIVGGGTSGWMTAAYLSHNFPEIPVTVVDKEVGTPIGVGEATLLNFKAFMEECGFSINEWFTAVDATYKSGILFSNWIEPGKDIWHPFNKGNTEVIGKFGIHDIWTHNQQYDFKKYALSYYDASIMHNALDAVNLRDYAYHVDCSKLVMFIQEKLKNKIQIVRSDVVNVVNNDAGIDYLELKNGSTVSSDLFIDCTGFKSLLRTAERRVSLSDRLFVNTAVACPIPYNDKSSELKPFAECDAVDHGWIWKIGVASRIGSGMVFNRDITSIDEAKEYFVNYWNNRISKEQVRVIDWTPFYNEDQWKGNVVSVGLSAGFIEPLESTGIALITAGITQISNAIEEQFYTQDNIDYFNMQMKLYFEDSVDFVSMHYAKTTRDTKFWSHVSNTFKASARMDHHLEQLANPNIKLPSNGKYNYIFGGSNWTVLLAQMGYFVAERNTGLNCEISEELLVKNYIKNEKSRHVWSRHHSTEIERLSEYYKL
jgi:tryptophan halogenase